MQSWVDVKANLIRGTLGAANLPANRQAERNALLGEQGHNFAIAVQAQQELIRIQTKLSGQFEAVNIPQTLEKFVGDLRSLLMGSEASRLLERKSTLQESDAYKKAGQTVQGADFLRGLGIGDAQLAALRQNQDLIAKVREASTGHQATLALEGRARTARFSFSDAVHPDTARNEFLKNAAESFFNNNKDDPRLEALGRVFDTQFSELNREQQFRLVRKGGLPDFARGVAGSYFFGERANQHTELSRLQNQLTGATGIEDKALPAILGPNAAKFDQAVMLVDTLGSASRALDSFKRSIDRINESLSKTGYVDRAGVGGAVATVGLGMSPLAALAVHHAAGGTVFKPKGTDTVPAMLTPGEFVVNTRSASANKDLLRRINAAKGPVHLADGGDLDNPPIMGQAAREGFEKARRQQAFLDRIRRNKGSVHSIDNTPRNRNDGRIHGNPAAHLHPGEGVVTGPVGSLDEVGPPVPGSIREDIELRRARQRAAQPLPPGDDRISIRSNPVQRIRHGNFAPVAGAGLANARTHEIDPATGTIVPRNGRGFQRRPNSSPAVAIAGAVAGGLGGLGGLVRGVGIAGVTPGGQAVPGNVGNQQQLAQQFTVFAGAAAQLSRALEGMPKQITMSGKHEHVVTIFGLQDGAGTLAKGIEQTVVDVVKKELANYHQRNFPEMAQT